MNMLGPQAYENLFQTAQVIDDGTLDTVIEVDGVEYRYNYAHAWELFDTYEEFKAWCIEDAVERQGEYADRKEE
tara:strand:- start:892 stop:1113 length:222 start_codon:yes stop_codon:yes gene_type:complete